jgi:hypothetical protein
LSEPLSVEFADRASGLRGWIGRGLPGLDQAQAVALLFEGERKLIAGPSEDAAIKVEDGRATAEASADGAKVTIEIGAGAKAGPLSAGPAKVELGADGERRSLSCPGAFGALVPAGDAGLVRTLVALRDDGASLALRALRPGDAAEHGAERVEAWLAEPEAIEAQRVDEPLLSTEYLEDGAQTRAGLELWIGAEDQAPLRGAGVRAAGARLDLDGWRLDAAFFDWTLEGIAGSGSYMIWRRGG